MSIGSLNTNLGAVAILQAMNGTSSALQATEKQISTGYTVNDAADNGGAYAVAQQVRSNVTALTSVNQQLGSAQGLVTTALTSLTSISNALTTAKGLLVKISDQSLSNDQRDQYVTSFKSLISQVADAVDNSTYNGQSLLGAASGPVAATGKAVINNESGTTKLLSPEDVSTLPNTLAGLIGATFSRSAAGVDTFSTPAASAAQTAARAALQEPGPFTVAQTALNNQLDQVGADSNYLNTQITLNSDKIDSLNGGLGALVDTDLSKESALLQSLQIKQQLGTQSLSVANQAPQGLLSLFK